MTSWSAPETMALYAASARCRRETRLANLRARRERAWESACRAAHILRSEFGAQRVAAFGSVVHPKFFHQHSDVDVGAWGIAEGAYLRAVARLLELDSAIPIDLIRAEEATEGLRETMEREGVPL